MFNLPKMEEEVQAFWEKNRTFNQSLESNRPLWLLLDGPPTMNGKPGVHHVEARAFKDLYGRYKTMQGFYVPRRPGWDCHGLPVELTVATKLGLQGKAAVEEYGVEAFNEACHQSVLEHQGLFEQLTSRMGYWTDLDNSWSTMDVGYVEKLWEALAQMNQNGLVVQDFRVSPWCTSCGTGLSSHEVAQGAGEREDLSVTAKFDVPSLDAKMLVWTTTPWTLAENKLVGFDPAGLYKLVKLEGETFLVGASFDLPGELVRHVQPGELEGVKYEPPLGDADGNAHYLTGVGFAVESAGTGFVHLAPAYGKDDFDTAKKLGVDFGVDAGTDGVFTTGPFMGLRVDHVSVEDLLTRGVKVYSSSMVKHARSVCWRCSTPLVDLARPSWFLKTTSVRDRMLKYVDETTWRPNDERFRSWVENNVDWALTRERFWGTPMPVWECAKGHQRFVANRVELSELSGTPLAELKLHRPHVDKVKFTCECGETMRRVPEVLDTWFDSGAAPYVLDMGTVNMVAEGLDQTRGWFYTLSAVAALLDRPNPFKEVLSLGMVLAEDGSKMSKSKGNVVDPFTVFDTFGADALRWSLLVDGNAWSERRYSETSLKKASAFYAKLFACVNVTFDRNSAEPLGALEGWLAGEFAETVWEVTDHLEAAQTGQAGLALERFTETLSNRYLRAKRNSLSAPQHQFVLEVLRELSLLLAPFAPHVAEKLYWSTGGAGSVHLESWPAVRDHDLEVLSEGRRMWVLVDETWVERAKKQLRLRQPLQNVTLNTEVLAEEFADVLMRQTNVKTVTFDQSSGEVKPNWRALGKRFKKDAQLVAEMLKDATGEKFAVMLNGVEVELHEGEDYFREQKQLVMLDTLLTDELLFEGRVADLLRKVVEARRRAGMTPEQWVRVKFTDTEDELLAFEALDSFKAKNTLPDRDGELVVD